MVKKKTSIAIEEQLWIDLQKKALDLRKDVSTILEEIIKDFIKKK